MTTFDYKKQVIIKLCEVINKDEFKSKYIVDMIHNGTSGNIKVRNRKLYVEKQDEKTVFGIDTFYKQFTIWFSVPPMSIEITPKDGELHTETQQLYDRLNNIRLEERAKEKAGQVKVEEDKLQEEQIINLASIDRLFKHVK